MLEGVDPPFVALAFETTLERMASEILVAESGFVETPGLFGAPTAVVVRAVREMATKVTSEIGLSVPLQGNLD